MDEITIELSPGDRQRLDLLVREVNRNEILAGREPLDEEVIMGRVARAALVSALADEMRKHPMARALEVDQ